MYVWLRFARMAATKKSRGRYGMGGESVLSFRCLPTDIDINMHLNNARYMMLADLGRIDIFFRCGLFALCAAGTLGADARRRPDRVRARDQALAALRGVSSIETWDGTQVVGKHRFILESGETAALMMTTAGVYESLPGVSFRSTRWSRRLASEPVRRARQARRKAFMTSHSGLRALAKGGRAFPPS